MEDIDLIVKCVIKKRKKKKDYNKNMEKESKKEREIPNQPL